MLILYVSHIQKNFKQKKKQELFYKIYNILKIHTHTIYSKKIYIQRKQVHYVINQTDQKDFNIIYNAICNVEII